VPGQEAEAPHSGKLVSLQFVPKSQWANHLFQAMFSAQSRNECAQRVYSPSEMF